MDHLDEPSIKVVTSIESVRKRPGMYVGDVGLSGLGHYLAGSIKLLLSSRPSRLSFTVEDGGYVVAADVALPIARTMTGQADCFEEPWSNVDGSVLNAFSERLTVDIRRAGETEALAFRRGDREAWTKRASAESEGVETVLKFAPDASIFNLAVISPAIVQSYLRRLSFLHAGIRFSFTSRSGSHEYHAPRGIVDLFDATSAPYILMHDPIHFVAEGEGLVLEAIFAHHSWNGDALWCIINNIRAVEGGTHEEGVRDALNRFRREFRPTRPKRSKPNGVVGVATIQYPDELRWGGAVRETIENLELREKVRDLFIRGASERLRERPDVANSLKQLELLNTFDAWFD